MRIKYKLSKAYIIALASERLCQNVLASIPYTPLLTQRFGGGRSLSTELVVPSKVTRVIVMIANGVHSYVCVCVRICVCERADDNNRRTALGVCFDFNHHGRWLLYHTQSRRRQYPRNWTEKERERGFIYRVRKEREGQRQPLRPRRRSSLANWRPQTRGPFVQCQTRVTSVANPRFA